MSHASPWSPRESARGPAGRGQEKTEKVVSSTESEALIILKWVVKQRANGDYPQIRGLLSRPLICGAHNIIWFLQGPWKEPLFTWWHNPKGRAQRNELNHCESKNQSREANWTASGINHRRHSPWSMSILRACPSAPRMASSSWEPTEGLPCSSNIRTPHLACWLRVTKWESRHKDEF